MFQKITSTNPALPTLIALSIGNPTPEKIEQVLSLYEAPHHYLVGGFEVDKLIGVIGLEIQGTKGAIKHIAVLPGCRSQGVGKALIRYVIDHFSLVALHTETDDDAIEFYRKVGFICQPFEGFHGKRYECNYKL